MKFPIMISLILNILRDTVPLMALWCQLAALAVVGLRITKVRWRKGVMGAGGVRGVGVTISNRGREGREGGIL